MTDFLNTVSLFLGIICSFITIYQFISSRKSDQIKNSQVTPPSHQASSLQGNSYIQHPQQPAQNKPNSLLSFWLFRKGHSTARETMAEGAFIVTFFVFVIGFRLIFNQVPGELSLGISLLAASLVAQLIIRLR